MATTQLVPAGWYPPPAIRWYTWGDYGRYTLTRRPTPDTDNRLSPEDGKRPSHHSKEGSTRSDYDDLPDDDILP